METTFTLGKNTILEHRFANLCVNDETDEMALLNLIRIKGVVKIEDKKFVHTWNPQDEYEGYVPVNILEIDGPKVTVAGFPKSALKEME